MNFKKMTIKEIEHAVRESPSSHQWLPELQKDGRKGVQRIANQLLREQEQQNEIHNLYIQMSEFETKLTAEGKQFIAGIDEVGRGCLAGPVVAAAVILPDEPILGLYDSKQMNEAKRAQLYAQIMNKAQVGFGIVEPREIDQYNIYEATKMAMKKAIVACSPSIDHLLIDAMTLSVPITQTAITRGDQKSVSIAAASIAAKVKRDNMMKQLAEQFPEYGFDSNVGYGTKEHLIALKKYGATSMHRYSFSPVSRLTSTKWSESR